MPTLTIALLSYNRANYIGEMVRSILGQSWSDFCLEVWDNASTDNTLAILKDFSDSRLQIHSRSINIGSVANMNGAINACQTDYILVTHDDDRMKPNMVERYMETLTGRSEINLISCNADQIDSVGRIVQESCITRNYPGVNGGESSDGGFASDYVNGDNYILCPTVLLNVHAVRSEGLLFSAAVGPATDSYFWCQFSFSPGKFVYLSESLFEYRLHGAQDSVIRASESISRLRRPLYELLRDRDRKLANRWLKKSLTQVRFEWRLANGLTASSAWGRFCEVVRFLPGEHRFSNSEKALIFTETFTQLLMDSLILPVKKLASSVKRMLKLLLGRS